MTDALELPLAQEHFRCPPYATTLRRASCAERWALTNGKRVRPRLAPSLEVGSAACRGCEIGRAHFAEMRHPSAPRVHLAVIARTPPPAAKKKTAPKGAPQRERNEMPPIEIEWKGRKQSVHAWSKETGIADVTIRYRYDKGLRGDELFAPVQQHGKKGAAKSKPDAISPPSRVLRDHLDAGIKAPVPADGVHPAAEILRAVGYLVSEVPAPTGVVLVVRGDP